MVVTAKLNNFQAEMAQNEAPLHFMLQNIARSMAYMICKLKVNTGKSQPAAVTFNGHLITHEHVAGSQKQTSAKQIHEGLAVVFWYIAS